MQQTDRTLAGGQASSKRFVLLPPMRASERQLADGGPAATAAQRFATFISSVKELAAMVVLLPGQPR